MKRGKARVELKLAAGSHRLSASFSGSATADASKSGTVVVKILAAHR